jgi:hypothetical protein
MKILNIWQVKKTWYNYGDWVRSYRQGDNIYYYIKVMFRSNCMKSEWPFIFMFTGETNSQNINFNFNGWRFIFRLHNPPFLGRDYKIPEAHH